MSFNLAVILSESAHAAPDKPVAVFDGGQLTYRQLDQASDRLAANLASAGIGPGDRVALQLPNIPQFLISYFGILKAGAAVVPLNVLLRAPEIAYHLEDSVGKPIWGTQTQVWDDQGRPLPPGPEHVGEIVTRGMHVMKGYLNQPEATAATFTGDWLHTGDLGYFDEDGFLFIVSRKKELIIRGGYNVYPSEIENVLHAHPAVAEAAVVGVPDERLGEEVMAVVIVRGTVELREHELVSWCRARLAAYKCPRIYQFRSELPKNVLGKVLKDELARAGTAS